MHQIRVHLQHLGFPIVNDPVYNLSTDAEGVIGRPEDWTVDRAMAQVRSERLAQSTRCSYQPTITTAAVVSVFVALV